MRGELELPVSLSLPALLLLLALLWLLCPLGFAVPLTTSANLFSQCDWDGSNEDTELSGAATVLAAFVPVAGTSESPGRGGKAFGSKSNWGPGRVLLDWEGSGLLGLPRDGSVSSSFLLRRGGRGSFDESLLLAGPRLQLSSTAASLLS